MYVKISRTPLSISLYLHALYKREN
jgi:hypothetical protein